MLDESFSLASSRPAKSSKRDLDRDGIANRRVIHKIGSNQNFRGLKYDIGENGDGTVIYHDEGLCQAELEKDCTANKREA